MISEKLSSSPTVHQTREKRAWRIRPWHWGALLCLAAAAGVTMIASGHDAVKVQVISPKYEDLHTEVNTTGSVVPLDEFPARANFSGMVEEINVHLGQKVHPGQLLVTMKDQYALSRLDQAKVTLDGARAAAEVAASNGSPAERVGYEADLDKARTEQRNAAAALASMQDLLRRGSVSQGEVEQASQRLTAANTSLKTMQEQNARRFTPADLKGAQDKLAAAQAAYEAEKISYGNAYVTSPIQGTVFVIPIARYDFVPAGADLLRVADLTHIQVHADFDEPDLAKLHDGQAVKITWDGKPNYAWHGHVLHAPMAVTAAGPRSIGMCTISVEDATGDLPADSHVTVVVTTGVHSHVLTIPREALHFEGANRFVFRVVDGKLARTPVQVGLVNLFDAEITSGLKESDAVVMHAMHGERLENELEVKGVR